MSRSRQPFCLCFQLFDLHWRSPAELEPRSGKDLPIFCMVEKKKKIFLIWHVLSSRDQNIFRGLRNGARSGARETERDGMKGTRGGKKEGRWSVVGGNTPFYSAARTRDPLNIMMTLSYQDCFIRV